MSQPRLRVRLLGGDDWSLWRDVRLRSLQDSPSAFGSTYEREAAFDEDDWRDRVANPESVAALASEVGRTVGIGGGFQDLPGWLHVVAMWVEPADRGRGVGHAVLDVLRDWASPRGLRLHLDVNTSNAAARRSYERYGFTRTGETAALRAGSTEIVERMVLADPSLLQ